MNSRFLLLLVILLSFAHTPSHSFCGKDIEYTFAGILKEDSFYGQNISLLNACNDFDRVAFVRHTLDYSLNLVQGKQHYGHPVAEAALTLRNKAIWGNPFTIAQVTKNKIKLGDLVTGEHNHFFPRYIFWMRECWLKLSLPDVLQLPLENMHTFTFGFFPFELGRGIALGSSYATGQDFLGFYTDGLVDQFAPGAKFSGEYVKDHLFYDYYVAVLENMSALISDTGASIYGQRFGRRTDPQRGFGHVHWAVAGRWRWLPMSPESKRKMIIEPYCLFVSDPEQDVEFTADASSKLGTFGIAIDYVSERVECGLEYAFNVGSQKVHGWDRNAIEMQNRNGQFTFTNSHVVLGVDPAAAGAPSDLSQYKMPHAPKVVDAGVISSVGKQAQTAIEKAPQSAQNNGAPIDAPIPGLHDALPFMPNAVAPANEDQLYNTRDRFRNPYNNKYKGWMLVTDVAIWSECRDKKLSFEGGIASGDDNPNFDIQNGDYAGFLGTQETYSGRKVRSAFMLGGAGKISRPLNPPDESQLIQGADEFAPVVNGFNNLIYSGVGVLWLPLDMNKRLQVNPNVLGFWQEHRTLAFDLKDKKVSKSNARSFLGVEMNLFAHYMMLENLKLFFIGSVFVPGSHYTDIRGMPLNAAQKKVLDRFDATGFNGERIPNMSDDTAFTFNIGFEYKF